jgi:hypothetical protein
VPAYRELERLRAQPSLSRQDVETALVKIDTILAAKGVATAERERGLTRVLGGKVWDK